ncbi:hypothetical protein SLA2020_172330 [Shorea laevis]
MLTIDPTKKRKLDESGVSVVVPEPDPITGLTPQDVRKLIERLTTDQLLGTVCKDFHRRQPESPFSLQNHCSQARKHGQGGGPSHPPACIAHYIRGSPRR